MNNTPKPPATGFILITDGFGDPQEIYSHNCVIDEVLRRCEVLDGEDPDNSPYSAWIWYGSGFGGFSRVTDGLGKNRK